MSRRWAAFSLAQGWQKIKDRPRCDNCHRKLRDTSIELCLEEATDGPWRHIHLHPDCATLWAQDLAFYLDLAADQQKVTE
jgi:hypothetical protein